MRKFAAGHNFAWTGVLTSAVISSLLGAVVLIGWYTHNEALIQINPAFVPMQYNTALGFLLTGLTLVVAGQFNSRTWIGAQVDILGAIIISLGTVAFFGYFARIETAYGWGSLTRMAIHTALGFIVVGTGFVLASWIMEKRHSAFVPASTPFIIGILGITFTVTLWQAVFAYQNQMIREHGIEYENLMDESILAFGLILTAALVIAIFLARAAHSRERLIAKANSRNQKERYRCRARQD